MEKEDTEEPRDLESEETTFRAFHAIKKIRRMRYLVMLAFFGGSFLALTTFLFAPLADVFYLRDGVAYLGKGMLQFFAVIVILYAGIQYYLEFGISQLQSIRAEAVGLASATGHQSGATSSRRLPEAEPTTIASDSPHPRAAPPSFDEPNRLAGLLIRRLEEEIEAQSRRANTNLGLGIVAAVTGLAFLGWLSILTTNEWSQGAKNTVGHLNGMIYWGSFASKLSLSLAANVFAFFFFTSYRRNLSEVRYFHNELTNVQARFVAVGLANQAGSTDLRKMTIKSLIDLERNFVLRKGETTAEVAMRQHDKDDLVALASLMGRVSQIAPLDVAKAPGAGRGRRSGAL